MAPGASKFVVSLLFLRRVFSTSSRTSIVNLLGVMRICSFVLAFFHLPNGCSCSVVSHTPFSLMSSPWVTPVERKLVCDNWKVLLFSCISGILPRPNSSILARLLKISVNWLAISGWNFETSFTKPICSIAFIFLFVKVRERF